MFFLIWGYKVPVYYGKQFWWTYPPFKFNVMYTAYRTLCKIWILCLLISLTLNMYGHAISSSYSCKDDPLISKLTKLFGTVKVNYFGLLSCALKKNLHYTCLIPTSFCTYTAEICVQKYFWLTGEVTNLLKISINNLYIYIN